MKKTFTILFTILFTVIAWGQTPQKISYQAVIRNSGSVLVTNTQVGIKISLLKDATNGTVVYTETQTPTTNANGLVTIEIGGGAGFNTINWASGTYYIQFETDPTGGTNYSITGTSQLLSVPYALYAKTAENITGGVTETDPVFIASPSNGITNANITNWNSSFSWGNHATAGYLTSFSEVDPKIGANISGYSPKWDGTALVTGSVYQDGSGNVGIGTTSPLDKLSIIGSGNFSTSIKTPSILPLDGNGLSLSIKTNNVSNANAGDISLNGGNNNSPSNGYGRGGDVTIAGGDFAAAFPTGGSSSRAGNVNIKGGATPNGGGGVGFPGNINLNGGEGGTNARGGAINLQAGSGNTGGNISITAGAGVGAGQVYIQGGTSTTLNNIGNVVISGGNKSGGGYYGTVIFRTSETQQAVIDNLGNFGIGTTAPTTKLDVNGIITATGGNSTNWNTAFGWGNHTSAGYLTSFTETDPKIGANISGYSPKWDGTSLVTGSVYQDGSGNVGIGTASPTAKLQVNGNAIIDNATGNSTLTIASTSGATPFLTFGGSSGGIIQTPQNTLSMRFGSNATASSVDFEPANVTFRTGGFAGFERLTINSTGNVGIGTTNPSSKLEVIGTITGNTIAKSGGTASQFLKADGSVDTNTYITAINEVADEFLATASQTSFTLAQVPSTTSKVKMYINGIRISNTAYGNSGTTLTYIPTNNGSYTLVNGDRIQFDYYY